MDFHKRLYLFGLVAFLVGGTVSKDQIQSSSRHKRLFSLFNIVTFKNEACTTTAAGNLGGTCLTAAECTAKGGSASGNCASGFGVCCLFSVSGSCGSDRNVAHNCTYIRNNGYPSADTTVSETCNYNFQRICDNLCQIRLDFNTLVSLNAATGSCGTAVDAISVTSPFSTSANAFPPIICGTLTGQHVYLETGTSGIAGTLSIAKGTTAGSRSYEIKVTYFTCDNLAKAPEGCTQYFTGLSGSFQSYNYFGNQLLSSMNYNNCFRQEEGYCRLQISESTSLTPDPFLLSDDPAKTVFTCAALSYLNFLTPTNSMFCGGILSTVVDETIPGVLTSVPGDSFQVGLRSLAGDLTGKIGFNLNYKQVACP